MDDKPLDAQTLQEMLTLKQRELDIVWAIDDIRDSVPEPNAMLSAIASMLADHFRADLILICLIDRETGELDLKAVNDRSQTLEQLGGDVIRQLTKRAVAVTGVEVWQASQILPAMGADIAPDSPMQLVAVPIVMGDNENLGAMVLARIEEPFEEADLQLLGTTEDLIDSAIIQGYNYHDLQQRNIELETIYRIDQIRDQHLSFDNMLVAVVQELQNVIGSEMGFLLLYNQTQKVLEMRATTDEDLFALSGHYDKVREISESALARGKLISENNLGQALRSIICLPLILENQIIGVMGVANGRGDGFTKDDERLLSAIGSQMDTAIFESIAQRRLRQVLGRSVDPRVMKRLLENPDVEFLRGERALITVLYADLRGSTRLAENTKPGQLVDFINDYLGKMAEVILSNEGTLDKFVGDEVMALFGAPFPQEDHALRAVRVGLEMQAVHAELLETWRERGVAATPLGVGMATGELTVGEFGYSQRTDYTVIGRAANLGARLCNAAKGGEVLISSATYELIKDQVEVAPAVDLKLKGIDEGMTAYLVTRVLD